MNMQPNRQHNVQTQDEQNNNVKQQFRDVDHLQFNRDFIKNQQQYKVEQMEDRKIEINSLKNSDQGMKLSAQSSTSYKTGEFQQSDNLKLPQSHRSKNNSVTDKTDLSPKQIQKSLKQLTSGNIQIQQFNVIIANTQHLSADMSKQEQNQQIDNSFQNKQQNQSSNKLNQNVNIINFKQLNSQQQQNNNEYMNNIQQVNVNQNFINQQYQDSQANQQTSQYKDSQNNVSHYFQNQSQNTRNPYNNGYDQIQENDDPQFKKQNKLNIRTNIDEINEQIPLRGIGNGDVAQGRSLEIYKMVNKIQGDLVKQKETNQYYYEELLNQNTQRSGDRTSRLSSVASDHYSPKYIKSMDLPKGVNNNFNKDSEKVNINQTQKIVNNQSNGDSNIQAQQQLNYQQDNQNKQVPSPLKQEIYNQIQQNIDKQMNDPTQSLNISQNYSPRQGQSQPIMNTQVNQQNMDKPIKGNNQKYPQQEWVKEINNKNNGQNSVNNLKNQNVQQQDQFQSQQRMGNQQQNQQQNQNPNIKGQNNQSNVYNVNNSSYSQDNEKLIQKITFLQKENDNLNKENLLLREKNEQYIQRLQQIENDNRNQYLTFSQNNLILNPNKQYNFSSASSSVGSAVQLNQINGSQIASPHSENKKKDIIQSSIENNYFLNSSNQRSNQNDNSIESSQSHDSHILKKLCEVMCVESPDKLVAVAKKYEKCIQSIPKLELFVTQIYNIVFPDIAPTKKNVVHMQDILKEVNLWKDERKTKQGQKQQLEVAQPKVNGIFSSINGIQQSTNQLNPSINGISPRVNPSTSSKEYKEYLNFYQTFINTFQLDESKEDIFQKLNSIKNQNAEYHKFIKNIKKILELDPQLRDDLVLKITFDKLTQYPIYRQFAKDLQKLSGITDLNKLYSQLERIIAVVHNNKNNTKLV